MTRATGYFSGFADPKDIQHTRIAEEAKDLDSHPADDVCHDDQMEIWADELIEALALGGHLVEPEIYDDKIALAQVLKDEVRKIVRTAFELKDTSP